MGTRSITRIHQMKSLDENEGIVCIFCTHGDGYMSGHGQDLADWLKGKRLVYRVSSKEKGVEGVDFFYRAGKMAVHLIKHIDEYSGCELQIKDGKKQYNYDIYYRNDEFYISVNESTPIPVSIYDGEKLESLLTEVEEDVTGALLRLSNGRRSL